jgi:outer membrane protein OmpA-like peptidoglycan-associated protein
MIQPNARPASKMPAAAPGPAGRPRTAAPAPAASRPVSLITGRPVSKAGAAPGHGNATAAGTAHRTATGTAMRRPVTATAGRPAMHKPTTIQPAPGRRPVSAATNVTAVRRPAGVRNTTSVHSRGVQPAAIAHRPGVRTAPTGATRTGAARTGATRTGAIRTGSAEKPVTGWPHHGKKHHAGPPAGTTTRHATMPTRHAGRHPEGKTTVIRHDHHAPGHHTPGRRTPGQPTVHHRPGQHTVHHTPGTPGPRTVRYAPGTPGHSTVYYTPGTPVESVQYTQYGQPGQPLPAAQSVPMGQPTPAGMPASQSLPAGDYGGCPTSSRGEPTMPYTTTPRRPCHNCGTSVRGCTTLSRFAFNSAELKNAHKAQLRQLAERILTQSSNTVVATGHADSSGTEDYNEALGEKRAAAVVKELKKQLSLLKPGSQKHLFWKIDSKGEAMPVSQTDAAANRRVSICVKKGSFSK